jgi:hypothetical protein
LYWTRQHQNYSPWNMYKKRNNDESTVPFLETLKQLLWSITHYIHSYAFHKYNIICQSIKVKPNLTLYITHNQKGCAYVAFVLCWNHRISEHVMIAIGTLNAIEEKGNVCHQNWMHVHIYIYIYVCVCVCIYIYIYIYTYTYININCLLHFYKCCTQNF